MESSNLRTPAPSLALEFENILQAAIGDGGLRPEQLNALQEPISRILESWGESGGERPGFLSLASRADLLEEVQALEGTLDGIDDYLLLGIGGSALGPRTVIEGVWGPLHLLAAGRPGGPPRRVFIADNVDPEGFRQILEQLDWSRTLVNVVSKSGSTVETLAQLAIVWERMGEALGPESRRRQLVFTTDPKRGYLRELATREGIATLAVPPEVGGRFSVLTAVGLFPALAAGIPPQELLEGARAMDARCKTQRVLENPAALLAAAHFLMDRDKGKTVTVLMPYSDRLKAFAEWFCQLWAESLGKSQDQGGSPIRPVGQTTLRALGTTDQHSQIQLFIEGPPDKLVTFCRVETTAEPLPLRSAGITGEDSPLAYLAPHTLHDVFRSEQRATEMALVRAGRPSLTWRLERLDARAIGALFQVYEVACAMAGGLYGINPYDQPAVEGGKNLTYGALGRPGYESHRKDYLGYHERKITHQI